MGRHETVFLVRPAHHRRPREREVADWVQQTVYEIINNRYVNNKSLVITTNVSLGDIRERYQEHGDAIVSRILEMCRGVRLDGPDWRKKGVLGNA